MEVLEINQPKWKEVRVLLLSLDLEEDLNEYQEFLRNCLEIICSVVESELPDFVTIETMDKLENNGIKVILDVLGHNGIDFSPISIPDYAFSYIESQISQKKQILKKLKKKCKNSFEIDTEEIPFQLQLKDICATLEAEIKEEEDLLKGKIGNDWTIKTICDIMNALKAEKITLLHVCESRRIDKLKELFQSLNFTVEKVGYREKIHINSKYNESAVKFTG